MSQNVENVKWNSKKLKQMVSADVKQADEVSKTVQSLEKPAKQCTLLKSNV